MLTFFDNGFPDPDLNGRSDYDLCGQRLPDGKVWRQAAVLIPIVKRKIPTLLLTKRHANLKKHPGQISFPGGTKEQQDKNTEETALREMEEEISVPRAHVDLVGKIDTYRTLSGFEIRPYVGLLPSNISPVPQASEVAEIFEVPLSFVLNRRHQRKETMSSQGNKRHYFAIPYKNYYIWGATAHMIVNLTDVLERLGYKGETI